jgi:hypothetical protein
MPILQTIIDQQGTIETRTFNLPSRATDDHLVLVNVVKFDRAWKEDHPDFYIGPGGINGIKNRYVLFQDYLLSSADIDVPEVYVDELGLATFTNGRHRFAVLRDLGNQVAYVAMGDEAKINAQQHGLTHMPYRRNIDEDFRRRERIYNSQPTTENLQRLNIALERSGEESYLPIPFMQNLVRELLGAISPTSKPTIHDFTRVEAEPGSRQDCSVSWDGHYRDLNVNIYTFNLVYPSYEGPEEDLYTNAHMTINMEGGHSSGHIGGFPRHWSHSVELEIYPDDNIYISYSHHKDRDKWQSRTVQLNQPWVYDANALLEYIRLLLVDFENEC